MSPTPEPGDTSFWKVEQGTEDEYWTIYEQIRPKYADSAFLESIYDYHSSKSTPTSFDVAHDIGCGFGKATVELMKRFRHVIASDSNESSLAAAHNRLSSLHGEVTFSCCAGEALSDHFSPQSADLVCAAECIPLLDARLAMSNFAKILKPHGTLAIWFYGRAHFSESEYRAQCQPIFDKIMGLTFAKVMDMGGSKSLATWKRAADSMESWLDNIAFPSMHWNRVERRKWNKGLTKMGFSPEYCSFKIEPSRSISDGEEVIEEEDLELWQGAWNLQGVKSYIHSSFPGIKKLVEDDENIGQLFDQLGEAMGGANAIRLYTWPVVLVLATRSGFASL